MIDLPDGKQVVVRSDLGTIRLQLWANKGSLGVEIAPEQAMRLAGELIHAARRARQSPQDAAAIISFMR